MPAPLARGIIIAASVIVAAGIAAYENPQFREWFDKSREKIAIAFQSTLDDIRPPRPKQDDPSMREDQDEKAEERRRQARQEILDRGKKLEELRRRKSNKSSSGSTLSDSTIDEKRSPSFDTLVDQDGKLRSDVTSATHWEGISSAVEAQDTSGSIRPRHAEQIREAESTSEQLPSSTFSHSSDFSMLAEPIDGPTAPATEPWESQYEREMRTTWNIPLPTDRTPTASTHPSESLVDLTPTTEDFPDPDYSVPSEAGSHNPLERTEYFSIPPSHTARSATAGRSVAASESESEYYYARPSSPHHPLQPRPVANTASQSRHADPVRPGSSAASVADSNSSNNQAYNMVTQLSEFDSEDDGFSELGDGVRTPASAWTEVGSTISASDADELR